jgi:hypothetical protein
MGSIFYVVVIHAASSVSPESARAVKEDFRISGEIDDRQFRNSISAHKSLDRLDTLLYRFAGAIGTMARARSEDRRGARSGLGQDVRNQPPRTVRVDPSPHPTSSREGKHRVRSFRGGRLRTQARHGCRFPSRSLYSRRGECARRMEVDPQWRGRTPTRRPSNASSAQRWSLPAKIHGYASTRLSQASRQPQVSGAKPTPFYAC